MIIHIPKEYYQDYLNACGVGVFDDTTAVFTFAPEKWAPAVWAGAEGLVLTYQGSNYKITYVNQDDRQLRMEKEINPTG